MFDTKLTRKVGYFVLALCLCITLIDRAYANPRYASIVADVNTGAILHQSNADASRYPASLTKMMTLYMLFEALEQKQITLDTRMPVSARAASMPQTNIGLRTGNTLLVRDAIPALIVRSANDVAVVVAETLGRSEINFARKMTDKARKMGMLATTFQNASGLPNRAQKTTARDMLKLSTRLMKDFPQHYHYFSTKTFHYKNTTYRTHNRMVRNTPGVDGLKTGFIRASGFNVATSAQRDGRRVMAVVMGGKTAVSRDKHTAKLLNRCFKKATVRQVATIQVNRSTNIPVPVAKPIIATSHQPAVNRKPDPAAILRGDLSSVSTQSDSASLPNTDSWGVQIGSYYEHDRAQAQAQAATRWAPGEVTVIEVEVSNRTLYRAQLVGLQKQQAQTACMSLSRHGMDCMVIRSHG